MCEQSKKNWMTEGVMIALIPALGYLFVFAYESGYAKYYHFPLEFINIDLPQIVMSALTLYIVAVIVFFTIEWISFVFFKEHRYLYHTIVRFLPFLGFIVGSIILTDWVRAINITIGLVIIGIQEFVFPLISQKDKNSYEDKLRAYENADWDYRENRGALSWRITSIFGHRNILLVINTVLIFYMIQMAGEIGASRKMLYYTIPNDPEKVVLRIYKNTLICADYDKEAKTVNTTFSVYQLDANSATIMKYEEAGPLKLMKSK